MARSGCRARSPRSRAAGYSRSGKTWVSKRIPKSERRRVREHETYERKCRCQGGSYKTCHKKALKKEHRGLSMSGISRHEGKVGAAVRGEKKR